MELKGSTSMKSEDKWLEEANLKAGRNDNATFLTACDRITENVFTQK